MRVGSVLVTGAAGALGSSLVKLLRFNGYQVCVTARRELSDSQWLSLDVTSASDIGAALEQTRPDLIVHLATSFENRYDIAYATNVVGAWNLLDQVQRHTPKARVVLAGSAAEYGMVRPQDNPIREDFPVRPVSIYGLTKSWQTSLGLMQAAHGLDVVIARIFNLDGPGFSERLFLGRVDRQIQAVLAGQQTRIQVGSLQAVRDYVSVEEAAEQILTIARHGDTAGVYHVASGVPIRMRDLLIQRLTGHGLSFDIVDEGSPTSTHTGLDVPSIYADMSRTFQLRQSSSK